MLWYSLEAPRRGASNEYPQHKFWWRNKKDLSIFRMKNALSVAMDQLEWNLLVAISCHCRKGDFARECLSEDCLTMEELCFVCVEVLRSSQPNGVTSSVQFT